MSNRDAKSPDISRRSVIKNLGIASAASITGVQTVSASRPGTWEETVEPQVFRPDVADRPEVQTAEIRIGESGAVSKTLKLDKAALMASQGGRRERSHSRHRSGSSDTITHTNYSLNLQTTQSDGVSAQSAAELTPEDLTASLETDEQQLDQVSGQGLPEQPPSYGDAVYYGHTKSQECGPLARTNVIDFGRYYYDHRENVDGDACDGEQWDEKFELFCPVQERYAGHCDVPDAFNTEWNDYITGDNDDKAGTIWGCPNFPAVTGTVVTAHYVDADGSTAEFRSASGIHPAPRFDQYDLDLNGIANAATDLANLFGASALAPFSWALSLWLLDSGQGVRF